MTEAEKALERATAAIAGKANKTRTDARENARAAIRAYLSDEAWVEKLARMLHDSDFQNAPTQSHFDSDPLFRRVYEEYARAVLSALMEGVEG